ncbi:MAG: hypothetical protein OEY93_06715 [Anaerolineae bacterium]|nr:hypothetical protein [Anaerolineae bacterium]
MLFGQKFDGVVEAVHYTKNGKIDWVRAYERRGPTWSDHVLLDRDMLVQRIESGLRFFAGRRIQLEASEFEIGSRLELRAAPNGSLVVSAGIKDPKTDSLPEIPII